MEPFTLEEERALGDKLDALPAAALQSYIASARAALGSKALAATWRARIEFGANHAELALPKALAAAARDAAAASAVAPAVVPKSKKVTVPVSEEESERAADEG